jgi:restriction system protein
VRRNEGLLDLLVEVPWWVSVVLSGFTFVLLRYVVVYLSPANPTGFPFAAIIGKAAPMAAPFIALFLLIPAPIAAVRQWRERRLLDSQTDLASIRSLSWQRFETLVAEAYRRQGYVVSQPSGNGPDGGVDMILKKNGNALLVQCKQWKAWKVGVKVVREMFGVLTARKAQAMIIVTSGTFTQEAQTFAAGKPIDLIEGQQLADLIRAVQTPPVHASRPNLSSTPSTPRAKSTTGTHPVGVPKDATPLAQVKPAPKKICPKCGGEMLLRTAQRGAHAGQQFWGCSQFPRCRATLPTDDYKKG